jgi:hypothetical protein
VQEFNQNYRYVFRNRKSGEPRFALPPNTVSAMSFEKTVKLACKPKNAPPKDKVRDGAR